MMAAAPTSFRDDSETKLSFDANDSDRAGLLAQDVEKGQASQVTPPTQHHEDTVSTQKKLIYLAGYFLCNIGLTLYNKAILGSVSFQAPELPTLHSAHAARNAPIPPAPSLLPLT